MVRFVPVAAVVVTSAATALAADLTCADYGTTCFVCTKATLANESKCDLIDGTCAARAEEAATCTVETEGPVKCADCMGDGQSFIQIGETEGMGTCISTEACTALGDSVTCVAECPAENPPPAADVDCTALTFCQTCDIPRNSDDDTKPTCAWDAGGKTCAAAPTTGETTNTCSAEGVDEIKSCADCFSAADATNVFIPVGTDGTGLCLAQDHADVAALKAAGLDTSFVTEAGKCNSSPGSAMTHFIAAAAAVALLGAVAY